MRTFARFMFVAVAGVDRCRLLASAQTSAIAGVVKDASGAVLPGVTVEASSPALIERVRSAVTDGTGAYQITALRPGVYTVTFTLPGFSVVKRDNVELTSDFTATINADMKVGAIEETITVFGRVADRRRPEHHDAHRHDARRDGRAFPTGRNIQAIGIMIPGTTIAEGGGGALSRDVGGSGNLQQSPLQYRGSGDTVQTDRRAAPEQPVRQRRLQRRLLERRQLSGNQLRDRRRLGRDGPGRHARQHGAERRRQRVPRRRLRQLCAEVLVVRQLQLAGRRRSRARARSWTATSPTTRTTS